METLEMHLNYAKIAKYWKRTSQPATLRQHLKSLLSTLLGIDNSVDITVTKTKQSLLQVTVHITKEQLVEELNSVITDPYIACSLCLNFKNPEIKIKANDVFL